LAQRQAQFADLTGQALRTRRLSQVYGRDPQAEGQFWYSVLTTGVYCRPACPSRRARPENIRFHDTLAETRATGFRPCGRCRPEAPPLHLRHRELVEEACRILVSDRNITSHRLAQALGLSSSHFHRLFRRMTGTTPSAYARAAAEDRASDRARGHKAPSD
jgi:AraC family transcriptional regulator of adaptative response/methylated-DNA-[protein]-cysteine methyltransferase